MSILATHQELRSKGKPAYGAPAFSRFVNRPVGRWIAAIAFELKMTPNQVTAISAILSLIGIALIAFAPVTLLTGFFVAALLLLGYAFDSADGQLARLRGGGSPAGEWLDHVVDMAKVVLLHGAIVIAWLRIWPDISTPLLLVPLAFAAVSAVSFFAWLLVDLLRREAGEPGKPQVGPAPLSRSLLRLPSDYGLLCLSFVLWGASALFAGVYSLFFLANLLILAAALPTWYRQARALGR